MFTVVEVQAYDMDPIREIVNKHEMTFFIKGSGLEVVNCITNKCYKCNSPLNKKSYKEDQLIYIIFIMKHNQHRRQLWADITESGIAAVRLLHTIKEVTRKIDVKCKKCSSGKTINTHTANSSMENTMDSEQTSERETTSNNIISYRDFSQAKELVTSTPMSASSQFHFDTPIPSNNNYPRKDDNSIVASDTSTIQAEDQTLATVKSSRISAKSYISKASLTCKKCSKVIRVSNFDSKDYKIKACMLSHVKMHTPTVPFQCNLCDYSVRYHNAMKVHMDKNHDDDTQNYSNLSNSIQYTEETNVISTECFPQWDFSN